MATTYRCEVHVGPGTTNVRHWKRVLRAAHLRVIGIGTERLHVDLRANDEIDAVLRIEDALVRKHKTAFGLTRSYGRVPAIRCRRSPKR
jgi:hypothetical protein